jgi:hypothetical protein
MNGITYVLSAHGAELSDMGDAIELPRNFFVHTYVPSGSELFCSIKKPNKICKNPFTAPGHYTPGSFMKNANLWPDRGGEFKSGVKDCATNTIVVDIDVMGETTLRRVIELVNEYHRRNHRGKDAHLHCLYCRSGSGGRRKTRQVKSRRRKTLRGGTSKQMVEALREAENIGRTHKTVGEPSQADAVAANLMTRYKLVDVAPSFFPSILLRDKYIASYNQATTVQRGSFLESIGLGSRLANLLS